MARQSIKIKDSKTTVKVSPKPRANSSVCPTCGRPGYVKGRKR